MKQKGKYYITEEQLRSIYNYQSLFQQNADCLRDLCSNEKSDIQYGFELGVLNAHLTDCRLGMLELHDEIENQKIK